MNRLFVFAPAGISVLDTIVRLTPVPADYAVILKLPTLLVCLAIALYARRPKSNKAALLQIICGAMLLGGYIGFTLSSLHSNPLFYRPMDNSVVGIWLTDEAKATIERENWSVKMLHNQYGPANWEQIYSKGSQLSRCAILSFTYVLAFALITLGLKRLPSTVEAPCS